MPVDAASMYVLHIANKNYSSWSLRPWLVLTELRIPFEERLSVFGAGSNWDTFRTFSPSGKVPCLIDGDVVVWDSLAIIEYLAERDASVWPTDARARAWARCAAAEMHSGYSVLRQHCPMSCGIRVRLHDVPDALANELARLSELWADGLDRFGGPFLAGPSFTAVDAFFAPVAFRVQTYDLPISMTAQDYATRLLRLDGMQAWQAAALAESWREPSHEADVRQVGIITEDMRS
jgi:glutathione S-transferase